MNDKIGKNSMFEVVELTEFWAVMVHRKTKVMYILTKGNPTSGLTLMVNADGTPMLWDGATNG